MRAGVGGVIAGIIFLTLLAGGIFLAGTLINVKGPTPSPQQVFEAHSLALDEGRYEDAAELLEPGCLQSDAVTLQAAIREFKQRFGLDGFTAVYPVVGTWLHDGGEKALLELGSPQGQPAIQPLRKIEGEWRLQCA